ncbi:MAG: class I SAM-dependent methyltransferase [Bacteroidota bacterium]
MDRSQGKNPRLKSGLITSIQKCMNCGLIFANPQPLPLNIQDHYGVDPVEYWNDNYFKPDLNGDKARVEKAILYGTQGGKILDIGFGLGFGMKAMLDAGLDVVGIEPSEQFCNYAISKTGIPESRIVRSTIEDSIFPNDHFDYVNMGAVLEHLASPSESLKQTLKWVKQGGKIEIEVPNSSWAINKIFNLFYKITLQPFVANISPMHSPFHLYEFDLRSFKLNGVVNHYKVIHHHYFVGPTYLPAVLNPPLRQFMKKTKTGMQLIVVIEKL